MRDVFELILSTVHQSLGDQAQDIIRSVADTMLDTLKSGALKYFDKKKEAEDVIDHSATRCSPNSSTFPK